MAVVGGDAAATTRRSSFPNVRTVGGKNEPSLDGASSGDASRSTDPSEAQGSGTRARPSEGTLRGLDGLNFFLADVQTGVGPFLAIHLAGYRWNEERVGLALTVGGIAGILAQTPAGALVDFLRSKRALGIFGVVSVLVIADLTRGTGRFNLTRNVLASSHLHIGTILAALVGVDVGPMVTPFGSLATMLVLALARGEGHELPTSRFVILGVWATPAIVVATTLTLSLSVALSR